MQKCHLPVSFLCANRNLFLVYPQCRENKCFVCPILTLRFLFFKKNVLRNKKIQLNWFTCRKKSDYLAGLTTGVQVKLVCVTNQWLCSRMRRRTSTKETSAPPLWRITLTKPSSPKSCRYAALTCWLVNTEGLCPNWTLSVNPPAGEKLWSVWTHQVHPPGGPGHHVLRLRLGPGEHPKQQVLQAEGSRGEGRVRSAHHQEEEDLVKDCTTALTGRHRSSWSFCKLLLCLCLNKWLAHTFINKQRWKLYLTRWWGGVISLSVPPGPSPRSPDVPSGCVLPPPSKFPSLTSAEQISQKIRGNEYS